MTQYFYSNFESEADDSKWGTLPTGWDDDYTTSPAPLEGSESCLALDSNSSLLAAFDTPQSSGDTYVRMSFRILGNGSSIGTVLELELLDGSDVLIAKARMYWTTSGNTFYRLYVFDSTTNTFNAPASPVAFQDAKYWLYLTILRGVSVTAEIKDDNQSVVTGYTKTLDTTDSLTIAKVRVTRGSVTITEGLIFDEVEVRNETNWTVSGGTETTKRWEYAINGM